MRLRLRSKILLLVVLSIATAAPRCIPGTPNYCSTYCVGGRRYDIFYDTLNGCPFRQISNVGCPAAFGTVGTLTYSKNCRGDCNFINVLERSFFNVALTAAPAGVDLNAPPSAVTINGNLFDTTYGMPRVEYTDEYGYMVGMGYASSVSPDGTSLVAPVPDLSQAYSGTYQVKVTNMTDTGYYIAEVGTATMSCWGRDRPDSDGDGWFDDEDCYPFDASRWDCSDPCQVTRPESMPGQEMPIEPCY